MPRENDDIGRRIEERRVQILQQQLAEESARASERDRELSDRAELQRQAEQDPANIEAVRMISQAMDDPRLAQLISIIHSKRKPTVEFRERGFFGLDRGLKSREMLLSEWILKKYPAIKYGSKIYGQINLRRQGSPYRSENISYETCSNYVLFSVENGNLQIDIMEEDRITDSYYFGEFRSVNRFSSVEDWIEVLIEETALHDSGKSKGFSGF